MIIGCETFSGCNNLRAVTIGSSIKAIGGVAFSNCSNLVEFNIGVEKFEEKRDEDGYRIPFKKDGLTTYYYGYADDVFLGCSSLSLKEKAKIKKTGYRGDF